VQYEQEEYDTYYLFTAYSPETEARVSVLYYKEIQDVKSVIEKGSGKKKLNNFQFSFENNVRFCKVYLRKISAGHSPSGFVRKMFCNLLHNMSNGLTLDDGIFLYACGEIRGLDYDALIRYYQKMGFSIVAQEKNPETANCHIWMTTDIRQLFSWCSSL
jgi:hypothetical protein